ncbi:hypothetical protein C1638_005285 [Chryseobacterium oncorhynchi]|uniref:Uncharacterized protein n=2 Tax=Chryseobacterium oncorhynchi TaxID=741074 RepID=A0A316X444_9FLAO|nr:hypothetical protein C1638_005285 [Chryseobacterium oncorhynchi]
MKRFIPILLTLISLQSCSQEKNKTMQNPNITADNIVTEISKQVKNYPIEPNYGFRYENNQCYFEVFINDFPAFKQFKKPTSSAFEINPFIFKNGTQKITYKLYPVNSAVLSEETSLTLNLESFDMKNESQGDVVVQEFKTPSTEVKIVDNYSNQKFVGAGKNYYEGSFDVKVEVPYQLHSAFENAQDLQKMDKKELEAKLLKKYKEIWSIYQNKELDNIAKLEYDSFKDLFVSGYSNKNEIENNWKELNQAYTSSTFKMQPIEKYKLQFFAGGKLAALMLDTTDNQLRGNTALWAKVDYDGGMRGMFINRYFYIPQGEKEFKVY